ncbi:MAG TPA: HNH endonuclease [Longimicrobiales bacterium]|nr:HNH endonuclease [Longimicrobiales bacterium]
MAHLPGGPSPERQVAFLQDLQRILDEGSFVATYKFALIHALADLAVERGDDSDATLTLPTRDIAERFIHLYWRQVVPFPGAAIQALLSQNTGRQAAIVNRVREARARYGDGIAALEHAAAEWRRLVGEVDRVVRVMPLWRLQLVGDEVREVLYRQEEGAREITLLPGVAACFRAFHPLVLDLVEGAWSHFIRRLNARELGEQADLREFLFGSERASLAPLRPILSDVQGDRCFYCEARIRSASDVDHFIPWWRYPTDLGHNFVLAHAECNRRKSDHLAAERHLARWVERNRTHGPELASAFDLKRIRHDLAASERIARWAYGQIAARQGRVWVEGSTLVELGMGWEGVLGC